MKMIYAGSGETAKDFTEVLFNCTRNKKCQRAFYVPVNTIGDIMLFMDQLPSGELETTEFSVIDACDTENVGEVLVGDDTGVIGQDHNDNWYGVFGGFTAPDFTASRFFFRFIFTFEGVEHVWYSEMFEIPPCEELTELKGCYPNEEEGVDAVDCNGIYYGYPTTGETIGNENFRYIHKAWVRMASLIEQRNKMQFSVFNRKRVYKAEFTREWLFEMELVPTFYKDVLIGILNRGNVQVNGDEYKLAESQDISIVDVDSKLWKMDMLFDSLCKNTYGCKPADCEFRVPVECVLVAFDPEIGPPELPNGEAGIPYLYEYALIGTAPFVVNVVTKPAWMNITVIGNILTITGTPPVETEDQAVEFEITNCEGEGSVDVDDAISVGTPLAACHVWINNNEFNITVDYIDCNGNLHEGETFTPTSQFCATEILAQDEGTILDDGPCPDSGLMTVQVESPATVNSISGITNDLAMPVTGFTSGSWSGFAGGGSMTFNCTMPSPGFLSMFFNGVLQASVGVSAGTTAVPIGSLGAGGGTWIAFQLTIT